MTQPTASPPFFPYPHRTLDVVDAEADPLCRRCRNTKTDPAAVQCAMLYANCPQRQAVADLALNDA